MKPLLSFIGFGEAAYHIATGLKSAGMDAMLAFDIRQNDGEIGAQIRERASKAGVTLAPTQQEACGDASFIASLTSGKAALAVATSVFGHLKAGQVYVDMNSAAPTVKAEMAALPRPSGVLFCDAAVMNTVPGNGHKVPMLLAGDGSKAFYEAMTPHGMNLTVLDIAPGGASAIKMFRSVFMKGLPQLMMEAMLPAIKYGALDALTDSLNESLYQKTVRQLADNLLARTLLHAERRAHEMTDAIATLEDMGLDASMSRGTRERLEQQARLELGDKIRGNEKMGSKEALDLMLNPA